MKIKNRHQNQLIQHNNLEQMANNLCEKALSDAKNQLHPLLQNVELDRLDQRNEFTHAFKRALEREIARKLAAWQPGIQAVFRFDNTWTENMKNWDGSIHLLVLISKLSNRLKEWSEMLDQNLMNTLKQLGWSRFQVNQSILEIQQVTPTEIRHGVSYGAMFSAVYSVPVKVWPRSKRRDENSIP